MNLVGLEDFLLCFFSLDFLLLSEEFPLKILSKFNSITRSWILLVANFCFYGRFHVYFDILESWLTVRSLPSWIFWWFAAGRQEEVEWAIELARLESSRSAWANRIGKPKGLIPWPAMIIWRVHGDVLRSRGAQPVSLLPPCPFVQREPIITLLSAIDGGCSGDQVHWYTG